MKILSERMRALRVEKKLRQEDVAKAVGVAFVSYCRYELDEREMKAPTVAALADLYGVSADYLLGRTDER